MAVEDLFFGQNARTAFAVGQARGVVMLAAGHAGRALLLVHAAGGQAGRLRQRRAPTRTRSSGWSARCCRCPSRPQPDHAADALAVAICHANGAPLQALAVTPMIASVRGEVVSRRPGEVVVEAAGVGYRLAVSAETLRRGPRAPASEALLHTHLVMRDDAHAPLRLRDRGRARAVPDADRRAGRSGPKVALAVLSGGTPRELLNAIAAGDAARFQAVPGIGKRTAERIIVELREKVAGKVADEIVVRHTATDDPRSLAREGLLGLGFSPQEADGCSTRPTARRPRS